MTECHLEGKKGTWDVALWAQVSHGRTPEPPSQSSAPLGITHVLLDRVPPSRKGGTLLVGGFVEFQRTLNGTEPEEKLQKLLPTRSLKTYFRTNV